MLDWDGARSRSGNEIRATATRDYPVATGAYSAGDKLVNTTTLDTRANFLRIETKVTNAGALRTREVYEALILPDKTVYAQTYFARPFTSGKTTVRTDVTLYQFNADKKSAKIISGKQKTPALDFPYETFAGQTVIDMEARASAMLASPETLTFDGDTITTQ